MQTWHISIIPSFSKEFLLLSKQVKSEIDKQKLEWEKLESAKSEINTFSARSYAAAALLFVVGSLAYMRPGNDIGIIIAFKNPETIQFGERCLAGSALSASSGMIYEYLYGKNTICEHSELFLEKLRKLDSYSAEINKKMDDSKISDDERARVVKYMNTLRNEWRQKLDVCKKNQ